jgi:hypothetical protein
MGNQEVVLNVDCHDIAAMDPVLYSDLVAYPTEVIPLMDQEAQALASSMEGAADIGGPIDLQVDAPALDDHSVPSACFIV